MTNTTTDAIAEAARLLREYAESLKAAHTTPASYGADWGDDEDALEEYCHMHEVALALERVPDAIERLTAERDGLRDVIDGTLAQAAARLEKCEAERDAALEDAQRYRWLRQFIEVTDIGDEDVVYAARFDCDRFDIAACVKGVGRSSSVDEALDAALAAQQESKS